jgi:hypothetical protein
MLRQCLMPTKSIGKTIKIRHAKQESRPFLDAKNGFTFYTRLDPKSKESRHGGAMFTPIFGQKSESHSVEYKVAPKVNSRP